MQRLVLAILCLAICGFGHAAPADDFQERTDPEIRASTDTLAQEELAVEETSRAIEPTEYLILPRVGDYSRRALHIDPIEGAIARGDWSAPVSGEPVTSVEGRSLLWRSEKISGAPAASLLAGGYAFTTFESPREQTMLLSAPGTAAVCLNGQWIAGDPYSVGWFRPAVVVKEGKNELLIHLARADARAKLLPVTHELSLFSEQATLPDFVAGDSQQLVGSIPLLNASDNEMVDHEIVVELEGMEPVITTLPRLVSRSYDRAKFLLPVVKDHQAGDKLEATLSIRPVDSKEPKATCQLNLQVVGPADLQIHTFTSAIDDTVQPYAVLPAQKPGASNGVLLLLHDAGQEPKKLLRGIKPQESLSIVAPYGRGLYGFDWEDWSADDAMEALRDFLADHPYDPQKISVAGRGMGGHGALTIATRNPLYFSSVTSINGWNSLAGQHEETPMATALNQGSKQRDPLSMITNLANSQVRILSDQSERQGELFRQELGSFHNDFIFRAIGTNDWNQVVEQISQSEPNQTFNLNRIEFVTPSIGLLGELGWLSILRQEEPNKLSKISIQRDLTTSSFEATTENISRIKLSLEGLEEGKTLTVRIDDEFLRVRWPNRSKSITLAKDGVGDWQRARNLPPFHKSPERPGGLKSVFKNNAILVYGTKGSPAVRRWAEAKARYDSALFFYRGNGRLEIMGDDQFNPRTQRERNVVLYGNLKTNDAALTLLATSPVWVSPGQVDVGQRPEQGEDLGVLLTIPRRGSTSATTALIGGTGLSGMRSTCRLRYFWSGVSYPDLMMIGPRAIAPQEDNRPSDDIRAVGNFGSNWSLETGDFSWRDMAL